MGDPRRRGQGAARAPVAAQFGAARSGRRCWSSRARTIRASRRPSRTRSSSRCATAASRSSTSSRRRGPRLRAAREQHGALRRGREVPRETPGRPLPGGDAARGRQRLAEITVDPKTVVLTKAVDAASVGVPKVAFALDRRKGQLPGQDRGRRPDHPALVDADDRGAGRNWVVTGSAKGPMGDAVDVTTLDKATLVPRKRSIKHGPVGDRAQIRGRQGDRHRGHGWRAQAGGRRPGGELFADGVGAQRRSPPCPSPRASPRPSATSTCASRRSS